MKKIFIMLSAVLCMSVSAVAQYNITESSESVLLAEASETRTITVHFIKQVGPEAWSDAEYTATYNPDYGEYGEIYIKGMKYTVRKNRAYGQERDGRADYEYVAADYYFNL